MSMLGCSLCTAVTQIRRADKKQAWRQGDREASSDASQGHGDRRRRWQGRRRGRRRGKVAGGAGRKEQGGRKKD